MQDEQQTQVSRDDSLEAPANSDQPLSPQDVSLEAPSTADPVSNQTPLNPTATPVGTQSTPPPEQQGPKQNLFSRVRKVIGHFNVYGLIFVALLIVTAIAIYAVNGFNSQKKTPTSNSSGVSSDALTNEALSQLENSDVKIGDPQQVLGIESNTVFAGKVLIRDSLEIAGSLKLGGDVSLNGLTVSGNTTLDQIQANGIAIANNAAVQGQLTVQQSLNVTGGGSFGGTVSAPQITVDNLQLNSNLQLTAHIDPVGPTPGSGSGSAVGSGGTSSVSGTDTAGTVAINTGGSPPAGCFITINFAKAFNATPHIALTPANSAAASLSYYVNRSANSFSVCTANVPGAGQTYLFDYIVID